MFSKEEDFSIFKYMLSLLSYGDLPSHIAFIMDGNRRYAKKMNLRSIVDGHQQGASTLRDLITWLSNLDKIRTLTVYAFSMHNFSREKEELDGFFSLAGRLFGELIDNVDFFKSKDAKLRIIGKHDSLSDELRNKIDKIHGLFQEDAKFQLNICFCYTSYDEIKESCKKCKTNSAILNPNEIFQNLSINSRPDLLIRTSSVYRLSDFLLMQCSETPIIILEKLFPEITRFDIFMCLLKYQLRQYIPIM